MKIKFDETTFEALPDIYFDNVKISQKFHERLSLLSFTTLSLTVSILLTFADKITTVNQYRIFVLGGIFFLGVSGVLNYFYADKLSRLRNNSKQWLKVKNKLYDLADKNSLFGGIGSLFQNLKSNLSTERISLEKYNSFIQFLCIITLTMGLICISIYAFAQIFDFESAIFDFIKFLR